MGALNKAGVPSTAVIFNTVIGLLLFFPFPGWQALIKFQSVAIVIAYSVGPISLYALKFTSTGCTPPLSSTYGSYFCLGQFLHLCALGVLVWVAGLFKNYGGIGFGLSVWALMQGVWGVSSSVARFASCGLACGLSPWFNMDQSSWPFWGLKTWPEFVDYAYYWD